MNQQLWLNRTKALIRHGWYSESHSVVPNSLWPQWTVACQAPLSMEFSRQEYWSGLPFPSPKVGIGGTTNNITEKELTREAGSERALKGDGGQEACERVRTTVWEQQKAWDSSWDERGWVTSHKIQSMSWKLHKKEHGGTWEKRAE